MEFIVGPNDFEQGKLKLRCVATISQVYSEGSEELIIGDRGQASGSHQGTKLFLSLCTRHGLLVLTNR